MIPAIERRAELYDAFDSGSDAPRGFLERLAQSYGLPPALAVLDVGCGTGRMFPVWAAFGWYALGVEPDLAYAERARSRGFEVRHGTFETLDVDGGFKVAVGLNSAFSHVLGGAARLDALRRLRRALDPGGVLMLDVPNFHWILRNYREPAPRRVPIPDGVVVLERALAIDVAEATFTTDERYTVEPSGEAFTLRHVYAMTSFPELAHLASLAGFAEVVSFPSLAASAPAPPDGARIVLVAR